MSQEEPKSNNDRIVYRPIDVGAMADDFERRWNAMSPDERRAFDHELDKAFPGGFTDRDEANALIAMTVRNGPLENLHAGKYSPLLEDPTLSRIADPEIKVLMLSITQALAGLLRLREKNPELYRRWIRTYGDMYCSRWEREQQ